MRLAFAGGGTGGHIVPGIHLLERALLGGDDLQAPEDVLWFTSGRSVEDRVLESFPPGIPWERQVLHLEPPKGGAPGKARILTRTPTSFLRARALLKRHRTQVLLGLGGFTTLPAVLAARSLGIPVGLLEINAAAGRATRFLRGFSKGTFHAWKGTLPGGVPSGRDYLMGAPVSPAVAAVGHGGGSREAALECLGLDPTRRLLLVLGGSQGAASLNQFIAEHMEFFVAQGLQVLHQCGPGKRGQLPADGACLQVKEYLSPVHTALQAATLILCRGGASTLAEVAAARRPALVVPYPSHTDRHQELNAKELGGGVRIVLDHHLDSACAKLVVNLSGAAGAQELHLMESCLAGLGSADASEAILRALQSMARHSSL